MLCIDLGTDMWPALSLGWEQAEPDVMTRKPRKRADHMVSAKLLYQGYLMQGPIEAAGCLLGYFSTMYYFGFPFNGIVGMAQLSSYMKPLANDVYNSNLPALGNTPLQNIMNANGNDCTA
jgi:sodium/potassium-transporting ATPase subunit alpha